MGDLVLDSLTQAEIKALVPMILRGKAETEAGTADQASVWRFVRPIHWSVSKKQPHITLEQLQSGIDLEDLMNLWSALLEISHIDPNTFPVHKA